MEWNALNKFRSCVRACVLFQTCLLHKLRGQAMAFLRTQMRLRDIKSENGKDEVDLGIETQIINKSDR